ncbi:MAG: T9SS type A sorting domain-containing protein [Bacteroidales bacterium]|nr:T9SS type A sorting domain-containing protein [Bacteroidales bacterium]
MKKLFYYCLLYLLPINIIAQIPLYIESSSGLNYPDWEGGMSELEFADINKDGFVDFVHVDVWSGTGKREANNLCWNIYPNPVREIVTIEFYLKENSQIQIELINSNGEQLKIWEIGDNLPKRVLQV